MADPPADVSETFLTERQAEVLALRNDGLTQREIADRLGTSVANVSGVESSARRNVAAAARTLDLARLLECSVRFPVAAGVDLRELVDEVYAHGDDADLRIAHAEPELTTHLHELLDGLIEDRRLVESVEVGVTREGEVLAFPLGSGRDSVGRR